jgi:hypothetical protein
MKFKSLTITAIASLFLTGCFDMNEEFSFQSDGTVLVSTEVRFSAALLELSQSEGSPCETDLSAQANADVGPLWNLPARSYTAGADEACSFEGVVTLEEFQEGLRARSEAEQNELALSTTLDSSQDKYRLNVSFTQEHRDETGEAGEFAEMQAPLMAAFTANRAMTWTVNAAEIIDSDGRINDDKTSATISIPLALIMGGDGQTITRFIEFRAQPRPFWQRWFD